MPAPVRRGGLLQDVDQGTGEGVAQVGDVRDRGGAAAAARAGPVPEGQRRVQTRRVLAVLALADALVAFRRRRRLLPSYRATEAAASPAYDPERSSWLGKRPEIGMVGLLRRVKTATARTQYDPAEDARVWGEARARLLGSGNGLGQLRASSSRGGSTGFRGGSVAPPNLYFGPGTAKPSWRVSLPPDGPNGLGASDPVRSPGRTSMTADEISWVYDLFYEEGSVFMALSWLGVSSQQDPLDAFAIADMLWRAKPDVVVEMGTNTGGSALFYATVLRAAHAQRAATRPPDTAPSTTESRPVTLPRIVTVDVKPLENWAGDCPGCKGSAGDHPYFKAHVTFIVAPSNGKANAGMKDKATQDRFREIVAEAAVVVGIDDAAHSHPLTLSNTQIASPWVTNSSWFLVQDTKLDRLLWTNNKESMKMKQQGGPMRTVWEFSGDDRHGAPAADVDVKAPDGAARFVIDRRFEYGIFSHHHRGFLRRVR